MDNDIDYFSIDGKNELKFISKKKINEKISDNVISEENKNIQNDIKSYLNLLLPKIKNNDKLKLNNELSKKYNEKFKLEQNILFESVNRILSFNSNEIFIFNKKNTSDLTYILVFIFYNNINKYKLKNYLDMESRINQIRKDQIDVTHLFIDKKNTNKNLNNIEKKQLSIDDYMEKIYYKDNPSQLSQNNVIIYKYPYQSIKQTNNYSLPIELIILLNKFSNIKKFVFPILHSDEKKKFQILFILLNQEWIFPNIKEVLFDLSDSELQEGIYKIYEKGLSYIFKKKEINFKTTNYDFKRKKFISWNAFGDISLINNINDISNRTLSYNSKDSNNKSDESSIIDYSLSSNPYSYNESMENLNLDYNDIIYNNINNNYYLNNNNDSNNEDSIKERVKQVLNNNNIEKKQKNFTFFPLFKAFKNFSINKNNVNNENNDENGNNSNNTNNDLQFVLLEKFININSSPFEVIILYSYFISLLKLNSLSLIFNEHFSKEIEIFLKMKKCLNMDFHFLLLLNKLNSLNELNIEFNSLDSKSFERIIYLIDKNPSLEILRISFFVSDVNYSPYSLLKLCNGLKMNTFDLIKEQKKTVFEEMAKNFEYIDIDIFLTYKKLYNDFSLNISKLFFILTKKQNLKELILLFDIPFILRVNDMYTIIFLKLIINIITMISHNDNKIETLKIISPSLPLDNRFFPLLSDLLQLNSCKDNSTLRNFTFQFKIYQCINLSYIISNKIKILFLGDLDEITFNSLIKDYKKPDFIKFSELISIKINLNLTVILLDNILQSCVDYLQYSPPNLKEKVLLSNMTTDNKNIMKSLINSLFFKTNSVDNVLINFAKSAENIYLTALSEINVENNIVIKYIDQVIFNKRRNIKKMFENIISEEYKKKFNKSIIESKRRIKEFLMIPNKNKKIFCGKR